MNQHTIYIYILLQSTTPEVESWLGNLYYSYRPQYFWYEMFIILRRLVLAILISVVSERSSLRATFIMATLLLALSVQYIAQPFKRRIENWIEEMALITITVTFAAQVALASFDRKAAAAMFAGSDYVPAGILDWGGAQGTALVVMMLLLNLFVLLLLVAVVAWPLLQLFWRKIARKLQRE